MDWGILGRWLLFYFLQQLEHQHRGLPPIAPHIFHLWVFLDKLLPIRLLCLHQPLFPFLPLQPPLPNYFLVLLIGNYEVG